MYLSYFVGFIADTTGKYELPFIIFGSATLCGGLMLLLIPLKRIFTQTITKIDDVTNEHRTDASINTVSMTIRD